LTPDLAVGDILSGVRREIERNAFRARNGIKYVTGGQWAPVDPTPSDTVWRRGKARLRRYRRVAPVRLGPPVIAFLGLVSRAYVLDLWKGNSFVQRLMDAGFDTFVLDWGEPDEEDAGNTLETYVSGHLPRAIEAVIDEASSDKVNVIGYCMGGNLALMGLAGRSDLPVQNLVIMATPIDFSHMGPLAEAMRDGRISIDSVIDQTGNVPVNVIEIFFRIRKPTADLVQYANLWENLWSDEYMQGYQAMGRWLDEQIPMPGAAARQIVDHWLRENAFLHDTLRINGTPVSLSDIQTPTLAVIATRDEIVPELAATPIVEVLDSRRLETLRLDAGHTSLTTGRTAAKVTVPTIIDWLARHSEEVT
jgi:polyhydroxyalkanoate synthase subunit PhaC